MARPTSAAAPAPGGPLRMTYEEWLAWDDGEGPLTEWVDGEVIVHMPPKVVHQRILLFLATLLSMYVRRSNLGDVFIAAMEMRLAGQRASREPDIIVVVNEHLYRVTPDRLDGPADLVVEIVSDDSVTRDLVEKRHEYAAAGVPEYWVFDPRPQWQRATFFLLGPDGTYLEASLDEHGRYRSVVLPGFRLDPTWLWQEPLPDIDTLLSEITGQR